MQQVMWGAVLLIAGMVLEIVYRQKYMVKDSGETLDVTDTAALLKEGASRELVVRASMHAEPLSTPPLGGKEAAYWETRILALQKDGQKEIYSARSSGKPYLQDMPEGEKLWVDMASFGDRAELFPSRLETLTSEMPQFAEVSSLTDFTPSDEMHGYRVMEGCVQPGQLVTLYGTVERKNGKLLAAAGQNGHFTYHKPADDKVPAPAASGRVLQCICAAVSLVGLILMLTSAFH